MIRTRGASLLLAAATFLLAIPAAAQTRGDCPGGQAPQATVVAVDGDVTARDKDGAVFAVAVGAPLCALDRIETGSLSRVEFLLTGKDTTTGTSNNAVTVIPAPESDCVTLLQGILSLISSVRGRHCVRTPFIDAGIEGTEAIVAVDGPTGDSFILVREGKVGVTDRRGPRLQLVAATDADRAAAFATRSETLTRATPENVPPVFRDLLLHPQGATDWAVYYPPVLLASDLADPRLREAAALLGGGDPAGAERALASGAFTGRSEAAALALRAVTAVALNDRAGGLTYASEAVRRDPRLGAAHVAQSYALQAVGDLDGAVAAARTAVAVAPGDAYAWARLAELELTVGNWRPAGEAVTRSLAIGETALGRAMEGFVALASNRFAAAEAAFGWAIELDSEAPLPRLGLGLARIRQGHVAEGRRELEAAVALDPRQANLRVWLGRAYLEEGLSHKAAAQFALAQERDPDDPNAFLFSALERFEMNDPIGALAQIDAADAVGGRRAVVRDAGGLAEDQSVRSIAAGRVFDVLGFNLLATQKAARAVDLYPANADAHRFLFDAYRGRAGFEVAQTSELMRYQLLSPPTNQPVQPSLADPGRALLTIPGVTRPTFYEFSPLFNRDGWFFFGSGAVGNVGTWGDEVSVSRLAGNFSVSVGQYHFEEDGFRVNDALRQEVVAVLAKYAPSPALTLTAEARASSTAQGLRSLVGDDAERITDTIEPSLLRLGLHAQPTDNLDILAVVTRGRFEDSRGESDAIDVAPTERSSDTNAVEVQGIYQFGAGHLTAGASAARTRGEGRIGGTPISFPEDQAAVYAYTTLTPSPRLELTLGLAHDDLQSPSRKYDVDISETQLNPKFGLRAELLDGVVLRAAVFRTLKRNFVADQTLEPTTIAGFAQFFDDFDGTDAWTSGVGLDVRLGPALWAGAEYVHRDMSFPRYIHEQTVSVDARDDFLNLYANATLGPRVALNGALQRIDSRDETPAAVRTTMLPVGLRYFHPSGLFAAGEAIWFDQSTSEDSAGGDESGTILNAAVGYRLRENRGLFSLELDNILDQHFETRDLLANTARPTPRPLADEFRVVARLTLSF